MRQESPGFSRGEEVKTVSPNDILSPYRCWLPAQVLRVVSPGEWIIGLGDGLRTGGWRIRIIDGCDELDANGARVREGDLLEVQVEVTPCLVDGRLTVKDRRLLGIRLPRHQATPANHADRTSEDAAAFSPKQNQGETGRMLAMSNE